VEPAGHLIASSAFFGAIGITGGVVEGLSVPQITETVVTSSLALKAKTAPV